MPAASTKSTSKPSVPLSALERPKSVTRSSERSPAVRESREPAKPRASRIPKGQPNQDRLVERLKVDRETDRWVLPVASYRLTGTFGEGSSLWANTHTGLDFATAQGTTIVAVAGGRVTEAGWAGSYGYRTIVELPDGTEIWYCHQAVIDVSLGQSVSQGQRIGEVGSTGNSTGPHVHIEVRPDGGDPVDPMVAFADHGARP
ncbi:M23 family metallopeptidase [Nocardioides sp. NPDC057772]|uniref:M23 family metallopeptidase n=1 Tax=unclassified Nocardioides TaxID=2615069 RepID=UPI002E2281CA